MQTMIFAAGLGTRLRPLTDTRPKALVSVGGMTLLERTIRTLRMAGSNRIVVNVHHFSSQITEFLASRPDLNNEVYVSDETEQLLDTGGGLKKARHLFRPDEPVLIHNVDILSNAHLDLLWQQSTASDAPDAILLVSRRDTARYLLFHPEDMRLMGWTNIKTGEVRSPYPDLNPSDCLRMAFSGIHVVGSRALKAMEQWPDRFSIIDFYLKECAQLHITGHLQEDLSLTDVGKIDILNNIENNINTHAKNHHS